MTTNAQHTPGKWMAPRRTSVLGRGIVSTHQGRMVCTVAEHDEAEANARLIAAAPDFADAAPDAADILEHYAEYVRGLPSAEFERHPYIPAIEEAAAKLRAAILKATGEPK